MADTENRNQERAQSAQDCTHNCMTCGAGCAENGGGAGTLEKALNAISEIDTDELLEALASLSADD